MVYIKLSYELEREKMMSLSLNGSYVNNAILYTLFKNKILDYYIKNISTKETIITPKSENKKKELNSNEQLLELLDNFVIRFSDEFYFIEKAKMIILEIILNYHKNDEYLFSKKYLGNNDHIEYFNYTIKKLIVTGFYENIKLLHSHNQRINHLLKANNINYKKLNLNTHKSVNQLYNLLKKLAITNHKSWFIIYLFEKIENYANSVSKNFEMEKEKAMSITIKYYVSQWDMIFDNYERKIKTAIDVLF